MASLIKPGSLKVVSKDGEVQVSLTIDLNVNINSNENFFSNNKTLENNSSNEGSKEKKDKFDWAIPDFEEAPKLDFGKKGDLK